MTIDLIEVTLVLMGLLAIFAAVISAFYIAHLEKSYAEKTHELITSVSSDLDDLIAAEKYLDVFDFLEAVDKKLRMIQEHKLKQIKSCYRHESDQKNRVHTPDVSQTETTSAVVSWEAYHNQSLDLADQAALAFQKDPQSEKIRTEQFDIEDQSWVEYLKPIPSPFPMLGQRLEELLRSSDEEIQSCIKKAQDPNPAVRAEVAGELGQSGEEFALPILGTLLRDIDPYVRLIASEAIGDLAA